MENKLLPILIDGIFLSVIPAFWMINPESTGRWIIRSLPQNDYVTVHFCTTLLLGTVSPHGKRCCAKFQVWSPVWVKSVAPARAKVCINLIFVDMFSRGLVWSCWGAMLQGGHAAHSNQLYADTNFTILQYPIWNRKTQMHPFSMFFYSWLMTLHRNRNYISGMEHDEKMVKCNKLPEFYSTKYSQSSPASVHVISRWPVQHWAIHRLN